MRKLATICLLLASFTVQAANYSFKLGAPISQKNVDSLVDTLYQADKGDKIVIDTSSPGGDMLSMYRVAMSMMDTKATVTCELPPRHEAASAAAVILVTCLRHGVKIASDSLLMVHLPWVGKSSNKLTEKFVKGNSENELVFCDYLKALDSIGMPKLLTAEQTKSILAGKDIYVTGQQVIDAIDHNYSGPSFRSQTKLCAADRGKL
jgi:predicted small secreted protein